MPSEQEDRDATATQFVAALGARCCSAIWLLVPCPLGVMGVIQLAESPDRRALHD